MTAVAMRLATVLLSTVAFSVAMEEDGTGKFFITYLVCLLVAFSFECQLTSYPT